MTDQEIMAKAFLKQFPPEAVVQEAIRLAREDERERLKPEKIIDRERHRIVSLIFWKKG